MKQTNSCVAAFCAVCISNTLQPHDSTTIVEGLRVKQGQRPIGLTWTSPGNRKEEKDCLVWACHRHDSLPFTFLLGALEGSRQLELRQMKDWVANVHICIYDIKRIDSPVHSRTAQYRHNGAVSADSSLDSSVRGFHRKCHELSILLEKHTRWNTTGRENDTDWRAVNLKDIEVIGRVKVDLRAREGYHHESCPRDLLCKAKTVRDACQQLHKMIESGLLLL